MLESECLDDQFWDRGSRFEGCRAERAQRFQIWGIVMMPQCQPQINVWILSGC